MIFLLALIAVFRPRWILCFIALLFVVAAIILHG